MGSRVVAPFILALALACAPAASAASKAEFEPYDNGGAAAADQSGGGSSSDYGNYDNGPYGDNGGSYDNNGDGSYDNNGGSPDTGPYAPPATTPNQTPSAPFTPTTPTTPTIPAIPPVSSVPGTVAKLRTDGKAAVPNGAPQSVRNLIAAANAIVGKPYKWGGGHAKLVDKGYDCSGTVSYALIGAGLLTSPMVSGSFSNWQASGPGKWVTTYSTRNHIYMEVAGLRLDTSPYADPNGGNGPRWRPLIGARHGFHVRHPSGL